MNTRIIVDSTSDLLPEIRARVRTVPLTVRFGSEEYTDGVTIDHETFYRKLTRSPHHPTTSQATPAAFAREYELAAQAGEACLVITLSAGLSGTWQSAVIAARQYENVYVVDSGTAAIGGGILTELAVSLLEQGMSASQLAARLEQEKEKIVVIALVDTLEYLKRGGRISKSAAVAGTLLNIKPVLDITGGQIHMLGKARGSKMANNLLAQEIEKTGGVDFTRPVLLGYTGLSDALLRTYIQDNRQLWQGGLSQVRYTSIGSVIGAHAGPGAIAAAFFKKG